MKRSMERSKTLSGELRERYEQFCEDVEESGCRGKGPAAKNVRKVTD